MSARVRGAVLALTAAGLLGAAVPLPWWSGHPSLSRDDGSLRVIESMSVEVGVLGFEGCRGVGGDDPKCEYHSHTEGTKSWNPGTQFAGFGFATLATSLLATLLLLIEGVAAATETLGIRRKVAVGAAVACALAGVSGALFLFLAPDIHSVPYAMLAPKLALGGVVLGLVASLIAMRPDREPRAKVPKAPKVKAPKPEKVPKPAKAPKPGKPRPDPVPIGAVPPGTAFPPIDFLALMEEPPPDRPSSPTANLPPPWQSPPEPSPSLPGAAGVLGTNMPQPMYPDMPPIRPAFPGPPGYTPQEPPPPAGNGVPAFGPNAPTLFPHQQTNRPPTSFDQLMPPPPPRPEGSTRPPPIPTAPPHASTQIAPPPTPPPGTPMPPMPPDALVMPIAGQTMPPTVIPVPPIAPPPVPRSGKPTGPPPFKSMVPAAAAAAIASIPDSIQANAPGAKPDEAGEHTSETNAFAPASSENTDMGPVIDPPPPADLDGRLDTSSEMSETVERSAEEVAAMRKAHEARAAASKAEVEASDETVPREKPSLASPPQTLSGVAPAPGGRPSGPIASAASATTPATTSAAGSIPLSTASPDLPAPTPAQLSTEGPVPACPQCESPMTWVEKHLRFYCGSCRMYF
jgi:hypothetical protein